MKSVGILIAVSLAACSSGSPDSTHAEAAITPYEELAVRCHDYPRPPASRNLSVTEDPHALGALLDDGLHTWYVSCSQQSHTCQCFYDWRLECTCPQVAGASPHNTCCPGIPDATLVD